MPTATVDLSEMLKGLPEGAWVAISEQAHEVLAYAADLQSVIDAAKQKGENDPLILRVPEQAGMLFL